MAKEKKLSTELTNDITRVGTGAIATWFAENDIKIARGNLFEAIEDGLNGGSISRESLTNAIAELEESGSKKIFLLQAKNFEFLEKNKSAVLKHIRKNFGLSFSEKNWQVGTPKKQATFIYGYWNEGILKMKFMELQYDTEVDQENETFKKIAKKVTVVFVIDTADGFTQVRFDTPGTSHLHKKDGKITEAAYESYYLDLINDLFPDLEFGELNLNGVANYIAAKEKKKFRVTKGVTTISNGAKQTFATASPKADVRDLVEYAAAESKAVGWRTEDLTGYWLAPASAKALNRDLFMRISRRSSQIRVQRGCLEKELDYGIGEIKKIQAGL